MKIILAQGNPGDRFRSSRHNIGWDVIDAFASAHQAIFRTEKKFFADIAEITVAGERVLLVKPTTFYNETGRSLRMIIDFYKHVASEDVLVLHDDIALPLGTVRIREKGSDGGNNGIKNISLHVGEIYWRARIGVWSERRDMTHDVDFVLGTFSKAETVLLNDLVIPYVIEVINTFTTGNLQAVSWRAST